MYRLFSFSYNPLFLYTTIKLGLCSCISSQMIFFYDQIIFLNTFCTRKEGNATHAKIKIIIVS